ncbi:MAG: hypothetical protein AB7H96_16615 [Vicinamibacterales bacterium]
MTRHGLHDDHPLLLRIQSEFMEMPGLCLNVAQASRLWNLDPQTSELALEMLAGNGTLLRTADGRYVSNGGAGRRDVPPPELD